MKNQIKWIVIHHSATPRDKTTFEGIKNYHIKARNFSDIGYHFVIDNKGNTYKGREENKYGAHCNKKVNGISMNFQSIGICVIGNFTKEEPTKRQIKSLEYLVKRIQKKYNIPVKNIVGHKEISLTLCPGSLINWILAYRKGNWTSLNKKQRLSKMITILSKIVTIYRKLLSLNRYH